jgi:SlyX protein
LNEETKRLEEKIAFLERHVTEQDKAMLELAEDIARLRREVARLHERGGGGTRAEAGDEPDDRPPHY